MQEEEKEPIIGEVNIDALEAVFVVDEVIVETVGIGVIEEEEIFLVDSGGEEEEDDVDLAFQEDEGYW